jgi:hypothetical protein
MAGRGRISRRCMEDYGGRAGNPYSISLLYNLGHPGDGPRDITPRELTPGHWMVTIPGDNSSEQKSGRLAKECFRQ